MAIFSRKDDNDETKTSEQEAVVKDAPMTDTPDGAEQAQEAEVEKAPEMIDVAHSGIGNKGLIIPRISEKAGALGKFNQYVFTVLGPINKVEVRKAVENMYGVKVANVNMIKVQGKPRRYGRIYGRRSDFKKAIVTLTADSKQIDIVEPT